MLFAYLIVVGRNKNKVVKINMRHFNSVNIATIEFNVNVLIKLDSTFRNAYCDASTRGSVIKRIIYIAKCFKLFLLIV